MRTLDPNVVYLYSSPYAQYDVHLRFAQYENGRTAIGLFSLDGESVAVATVNLPDERLGPNEIFVKNWSENEKILDFLLSNGIVKLTNRTVASGYVTVPVCQLLVQPESNSHAAEA